MWNQYFTQTGSRLLLLLVQCIGLGVCIAYIQYFYLTNILPDKEAKDYFQQTNCFVISEKLSIRGRVIHKYRADFLINYRVEDAQYTKWVSGNGLDISFSSNQLEQQGLLSQFDVGGNYPCWFDPRQPDHAILILRHNWLSTFPLFLPSVMMIIILYYLVTNLFQLFSEVKIKKGKK